MSVNATLKEKPIGRKNYWCIKQNQTINDVNAKKKKKKKNLKIS